MIRIRQLGDITISVYSHENANFLNFICFYCYSFDANTTHCSYEIAYRARCVNDITKSYFFVICAVT